MMMLTLHWFLSLFLLSAGLLVTAKSKSKGIFNTEDIQNNELEPKWSPKKSQQKVVAVPMNHIIELKCPAEGHPKPNITWYKDGKLLTKRRMGKIERRRWTLRLSEAGQFDEGNYTCVIMNRHGRLQWTYKVEVIATVKPSPPIIRPNLKNQTVFEGETAQFECSLVSSVGIHIQWVKHYTVNGSYINPEGHPYVKLLQISNENLSDPNILTIRNASFNDTGLYTCIAHNTYGRANTNAFLIVEPLPPTEEPTLVYIRQDLRPKSMPIILYVSVGGVVIVLGIFASLVYLCWCQRSRRKMYHKPRGVLMKANELYSSSSQRSDYLIPVDRRWEFPAERLTLGDVIGEGAFGQVLRGVARGILGKATDETIVAVKMLKDMATQQEVQALIQEVQTNKVIGCHKNVISLLGCCTRDGPLMLIFEFAKHGNLRDFLRAQRPSDSGYEIPLGQLHHSDLKKLTQSDLVSFAYQIATGMDYLAGKKIVHRDLAARNVLVTEEMQVKIGDFGLTRGVEEDSYYWKRTRGPVPVKWMAPEALYDGKYSTKSDVWAYGVLLWEIYSLGATPYPTIQEEQLYRLLKVGHRMPQPPYCNDVDMYSIMLRCWQLVARKRPTFSDLVKILERRVAETSDHTYLRLEPRPSDSGPESLYDMPNSPERSSDSQYCSLPSNSTEDVTLDGLQEEGGRKMEEHCSHETESIDSAVEEKRKYAQEVSIVIEDCEEVVGSEKDKEASCDINDNITTCPKYEENDSVFEMHMDSDSVDTRSTSSNTERTSTRTGSDSLLDEHPETECLLPNRTHVSQRVNQSIHCTDSNLLGQGEESGNGEKSGEEGGLLQEEKQNGVQYESHV